VKIFSDAASFFLNPLTTSTTFSFHDTPSYYSNCLVKSALLPNIYPSSTTRIRPQLHPPYQKWQRMFLPLVYFPASHARAYRQSALHDVCYFSSNDISFPFLNAWPTRRLTNPQQQHHIPRRSPHPRRALLSPEPTRPHNLAHRPLSLRKIHHRR
jgi:hypothetical protein